MNNLHDDNSGQTMLEIILALGVMTMVIVSIITLVTRGISTSGQSSQNLIAIELAREGIEVARGVRDSNWLSGENWDEFLFQADGDRDAVPVFEYATNEWSLDFSLDGIEHAPVMLDDGMYLQSDTQSGRPTEFYRILEFEFLDKDITGVSERERYAVQVTSRVRWKDRGKYVEIKIQEELFNWR